MSWSKEEEQRLRQVVKDSGVKLLKENLVQGTWGNTGQGIHAGHAHRLGL